MDTFIISVLFRGEHITLTVFVLEFNYTSFSVEIPENLRPPFGYNDKYVIIGRKGGDYDFRPAFDGNTDMASILSQITEGIKNEMRSRRIS